MTILKRMLAILAAILLLFSLALAEEPQAQWVSLGTGSNEMTLVVVFPDLTTKGYHIHSDCTTMLEALLELELVTVAQQDGVFTLTAVDGCALPADQPDAYWFISMHDPVLDSLTPVTLPLDQLPLAGQTYAFGMIDGGLAQ